MKKLKSIFIITFLLLGYGCTTDNLEEYYNVTECDELSVTYNDDIKPIIEMNCLLSGCHGSNPSLPDWGNISTLQANAEKVKSRTSNGTMPPSSSGRSLTAEQVQKIACWVENGAQNN